MRILILAITLFIISTCKPPDKPSTSFYYWKTVFQLTDVEKHVLQQNGIEKLYVRYFDVALKTGNPMPVSPITFKEPLTNISVIAVVYIRNDVMLKENLDIEDLARKTIAYIDQINKQYSINIAGIQLDCDWTVKSKVTYFQFIDHVKKRTAKPVSATIRLHQIKYAHRTGIPPVESGVLMYYNMGHIAADKSNSIYEHALAARYVNYVSDYPLMLNVALPIFSWGVHSRNGKVIKLLNKIDETSFRYDSNFVCTNGAFFEVKNNVIKLGHSFQTGDQIKIESVGKDDLKEMGNDLSARMNVKPKEIIFYDLDDFNLKRYSDDKQFFQEIGSNF